MHRAVVLRSHSITPPHFSKVIRGNMNYMMQNTWIKALIENISIRVMLMNIQAATMSW